MEQCWGPRVASKQICLSQRLSQCLVPWEAPPAVLARTPVPYSPSHLRSNIFYLWRPFLTDPRDDLVLELAVEAQASCIVTHNLRDFAGTEQFGIEALSPGAFLRRLEASV